MDPRHEFARHLNRRYFLERSGLGLGTAALASLLDRPLRADSDPQPRLSPGRLPGLHHPPRARRVISLLMADAPSQLDLFDHKPDLIRHFDKDLPESVRLGQRITTMTSGQSRLPVAPSLFRFRQHGQSGAWFSELMPHLGAIADELTFVRSVHTEAINHDPALTFVQTGSELPGRPSLGAWLSYGIGSPNASLPAFVVLHSRVSDGPVTQPLFSRVWGSGFLPTTHQGVMLRSSGDPVLYLSNPPGVDQETRRLMLDGLGELNRQRFIVKGDSEISSRIEQYEMAFRMQTSVPDLIDISDEPKHVLEMYGPDVTRSGTFAANCLFARRLAERDVRFIQVILGGWDHHGRLPEDMRKLAPVADRASAALIRDLRQRGLLDDTLVVWGGEFGRTVYCQGTLTRETYGRDHHPRCFTMWLAGGGVKPGIVHGQTDDFSYNIVENPVHIHDLNATILHLLGIDHERLTFRSQGRDFRLTDVHGQVVHDILA